MKLFPWQQDAAKNNNQSAYAKFSESSWQSAMKCSLRGQLDFTSREGPIDVSEVEPASEIVKRFCTGTPISLLISWAHLTLQSPVVYFLSICLAIPLSGLDKWIVKHNPWTGNHQKTACPANKSASSTFFTNMIKSKTTIVIINLFINRLTDIISACVSATIHLFDSLWTHFDMPAFPITCRIKSFVNG